MLSSLPTDEILGLVRLSLDVHCIARFLPQEDGTLVLDAASCANPQAPFTANVAPRGLVGWIVRNKKPLIVDHFEAENSQLGYYNESYEFSVASFMGFPLPSGGALCVDTLTARTFSQREQQALAKLATYCDVNFDQNTAINHASVQYFHTLTKIQELRRQRLPWQKYLKQFLDLVAVGAGMTYSAFASIPEDNASYVIEKENIPLFLEEGPLVLPVTTGIAGWVFRNDGLPVFTTAEGSATAPLFDNQPHRPHFETTICLPVVLNNATCAVLCLAHENPQDLHDDLRLFVHAANAELISYLENITLKHRVQQLLPKAKLHHQGPVPHDPDAVPPAQDK